MRKNYHIETINTNCYPAMVFSVSYVSPIDVIGSVENDLKHHGIKGKIVFDLLLCNGDNPDRYFEAVFNGQKVDLDSFKQLNQIDVEIKKASCRFYRETPTLLDNTVLTKACKYVLRSKK